MNNKRTWYRASHLVMAAYLFAFLGWMVPHHACDHTLSDLSSHTGLANPADHHAAHNPDLCQLCKTHGQLDLLAIRASHVQFDGTPSRLPVEVDASEGSSVESSPFSRAPPILG